MHGNVFADLLEAFGVRVKSGANVTQQVSLTLAEVASGCDKVVSYDVMDRCATCLGSGMESAYPEAAYSWRTVRCAACSGRGLHSKRQRVTLEIPAGIEDGATWSMRGAGHRSDVDGEPGDLEVLIRVERHPLFERENADILSDVEVSFTTAALGGQVEAKTLYGAKSVRIPPRTQQHTRLRLRGLGVPHRRRQARGDHICRVRVTVPNEVNERTRALLVELDRELREQARPEGFWSKLRNWFVGG